MATESTLNAAKAWHPDISYFPAPDVLPEALILQTSTIAGAIEGDEPAVRVPYVDDAAADFVAEAAEIPESDPALAEAVVHTGKISQLVRVSAEQYRTLSTADLLAASVSRAVTRRADEAYLVQPAPKSPATTPPAGLVNLAGVNGGAVANTLDGLIDLIATLEGNGATPSHIILDPKGWASVQKLKTATGSNVGILGAGTQAVERMLLSLPVLVSSAMAPNTGLVVDKTAIVSAVGELRVATSEDFYFSSDSIAIRATWRIGWNVVKADRLGKFTITSPAAA